MSDNLFSQHWYRIAGLKPKLHSHAEIHRHDYRGLIWYIIDDSSTGRSHRFNPAAYQFIGMLDGNRTVEEIYPILVKQLGDFAPTQDEIIQLMGQLHQADLINTGVLINTDELFDRQSRFKQGKLAQRYINPISQKIPLWDPEEFLQQHVRKIAWLFTPWMGFVWMLFVGLSALQAVSHWGKISRQLDINTWAPSNIILMFLLYPLIKILHELGHAFATKLKGGEVHEMGVNFMLFMPVPYVNASSSNNFRSKYDRILVSSAGILVETFLAALGLNIFLSTQPGVLHDIGYNAFVIGGISSFFFNGNPLLKYDGYYVLADLLGIPNLYQRSIEYWRYLLKRKLLGLTDVVSPATAPGESFWFFVYCLGSLLYRLSILWFICIYVTDKFFSIGVILAIWMVTIQIVVPLYKAVKFTLTYPVVGGNRTRAIYGLALSALGLVLLGFMPIPSYTQTEGVVWLPDEAIIKAEHDGFIDTLQATTNRWVQKEELILKLRDDMLETKARIIRSKLMEIQSDYRGVRETELVKASILKEEYRIAQSEQVNLTEKIQSMSIKAAKSGILLLPDADDLPGRYITHGEVIGYILDDNPPTIRVAVSQDHIGQLRNRIVDIKVRLSNRPEEELTATLIRLKPEATNKLFSPALSPLGGGHIQIDPGKPKEMETLQKIFWVDLKVDPKNIDMPIGARAYIRFNHGGEPIVMQWYRRVRQAFLRQFHA